MCNFGAKELQFRRSNVFTRIATALKIDVHWLCTGQTPDGQVAFDGVTG